MSNQAVPFVGGLIFFGSSRPLPSQ